MYVRVLKLQQQEPGTPAHSLVTFEICTEKDHHVLHDGWRSFPSGHSSFAFSGLGYLALFLAGQLYVFRPRTDLARALLALAPMLGAALIAISRCEDYRHDVYDVTTGSLLGFFIALFTYRYIASVVALASFKASTTDLSNRRYYPPLRNRLCDTPYPNAMDAVESRRKAKDEESGARDPAEFELDDEDEAESIPLNAIDRS